MRVGVIGATGFLGSNLLRHLEMQSKYELTAISRKTMQAEASFNSVVNDLTDVASVAKLIDKIDIVYYFAHQGAPNSPLGWISEVEKNLHPLMCFLEAAKIRSKSKPLKIIYASSGGAVYGVSPTQTPWAETDQTSPVSAYGVTKLTAEHFLRLSSLSGTTQITCLRISNPYGNNFYHSKDQGLVDVAIRNALEGRKLKIIGSIKNIRDFLHIDDLNTALEKAIDLPHSFNVLNIGSGQGSSINEVVDLLEKKLGQKIEKEFHPVPEGVTEVSWSVLDIQLAKKLLAWEPKLSLAKGLDSAIQRSKKNRNGVS